MENDQEYGLEQTTEDRSLFTCRYLFDLHEERKLEKCFHRLYRYQVLLATYRNIAVCFFLSLLIEEPKSALFLFLFLELIIVIGLAIKLDSNLEKRYSERFSEDLEGEFEFYQDYFVLKTENITSKTQYTRIDRCVETDTNFYLECKRKNTTCVIQKEVCDPALMSFLREKMNVVEKHVRGIKRAEKSGGAKRTGKKEYYDPTVVNTMMNLLFILTIACLWLAQIVTYKISMAVIHTYDMVRFSWIDWCFLPIPITSVVLGYKYQDAGFKCKKNIIAGYIIGFILAIFGSYWLIFP